MRTFEIFLRPTAVGLDARSTDLSNATENFPPMLHCGNFRRDRISAIVPSHGRAGIGYACVAWPGSLASPVSGAGTGAGFPRVGGWNKGGGCRDELSSRRRAGY